MFQKKEQGKTWEEHISDVEIGNLSKKEFRVMIIKMIQELGKDWMTEQEVTRSF